MGRKRRVRRVLTESEADFLDKLIMKNRSLIAHSVKRTLEDVYEYLYDDCISETYLTACENIDKLLTHENPDGWIVLAAKITARRLKSENENDLKHCPLDEAIKIEDPHDINEDAVYKEWMRNNVDKKIIKTLTPREQQVYKLLYVKKMSTKDVAEELGISINTVWSINRLLRNKVKTAVEEKSFEKI